MINRLLLVAMLFLASACRAIAGELTCATPQSEEEANSDRRSNYEKCFDPCEWADAAIVACKAFTELPTLANRRATAEALAMLGALYLEKHATADAMSALSGAVRLNPDLWWAYVNRGNAYMH